MTGRGRKDLLRESELRACEVNCWMKQTPNSQRQGMGPPKELPACRSALRETGNVCQKIMSCLGNSGQMAGMGCAMESDPEL